MINPFNFFDKIYCINLPDDKERKREVSKVFSSLKILRKVIFISAPRPPVGVVLTNVKIKPSGVLGVSLSNLKAVFDASFNNAKNFLVFEDDIELIIDEDSGLDLFKQRLLASIKELPKDWDILYLGGKPKRKVITYSPNLVKTSHMVGAYAYAMNRKAMPGFINAITAKIYKYPYDGILGTYGMVNNSYCVYPPMVSTKPGYSVLRGQHRDYREGTRKAWKRMTS